MVEWQKSSNSVAESANGFIQLKSKFRLKNDPVVDLEILRLIQGIFLLVISWDKSMGRDLRWMLPRLQWRKYAQKVC
jgi:hypothetical protein